MRHAEAGFTLIEVLVALVVAGTLIVLVFDAAQMARTQGGRAAAKRDAERIARNLLANPPPADRSQSAGREGGFSWTLTRRLLDREPRGLYQLNELTVDVVYRRAAIARFATRRIEPVGDASLSARQRSEPASGLAG